MEKNAKFDDVMSQIEQKLTSDFSWETQTDEAQTQFSMAGGKYWVPQIGKANLEFVKDQIKYEAKTTDNYIDSDTKWMYNKKNGNRLFALYSTEVTDNPTVLYASSGETAEFDMQVVSAFMEEFNNATITNRKALDTWVKNFRMFSSTGAVNISKDGNARKTDVNDGVDGRTSRRKPSAALESCLRNIVQHSTPQFSIADDYVEYNYRAIVSDATVEQWLKDYAASDSEYARNKIEMPHECGAFLF